MVHDKPRILLFDIETTPNTLYTWDLFPPGGRIPPENIVKERYILCASWQWLGEKKIETVWSDYKAPIEDMEVLKTLRQLFCEADGLIAHNGDKFDLPWVIGRLVINGFQPPPPIPMIDTRLIARKRARFNSNKLDYLAGIFGIPHKIKMDFQDWLDCMAGDPKAIRKMTEYNRHDVRVLEAVYHRLKPLVPAKVNASLWGNDERICPTCFEKALVSRGVERTRVNVWHRYQCKACGAWSKMPSNGSKVIR